MGIAAALLVLAAGIATVPKIRSLINATGSQQTVLPAAPAQLPFRRRVSSRTPLRRQLPHQHREFRTGRPRSADRTRR